MQSSQKTSHPVWRFFIDNYRITYILLLAVVVFGVISVLQMPKESAPEVDIPVAVVTTTLPGAGAQDVEELVTNPLEDQISGMSDITDLQSTSEQGISTIQIQYDSGVDSSDAIDDLRSRVERAEAELPADANEPRVQKISFSDQPILTMALSGPYEPSQLKGYAEALQDELEGITSVSQVRLRGAPEREIKVQLNPSQLNQYNLSPSVVSQALSQANTDVPLGAIETNGTVYTLRFDGRLADARDVRSVAVALRGGSIVSVGDIARVEDTYTDQSTLSRFSSGGAPARPTVSLQLFKQSGEGNILSIDREAREIADEMRTTQFPGDVGIEVVRSDAEVISSDLWTLTISGIVTVFIIFGVLTLFLGWREALLASLVVPVSFLITFIVIYLFGLTINFLTLFSLILSLGIIVDAAIVVTESIFTKRAAGDSGIDAAMKTIDEFQTPLVAGTLTTVFVFLPMLLTGGTIGEFIVSIPITVSAVLVAALFVSLGVITTLTTRFLGAPNAVSASRVASPRSNTAGLFGFGRLMQRLYRWYSHTMSFILARPRRSYVFLSVVGTLFVVSVSFPFLGVTAVNMFPAPDADTIYIDLEAPAGTPLSETRRLIGSVEGVVSNDERVTSYLTTVGQGSQAGSIDVASVADSHLASMTLNLVDERDETSREIERDYQVRFADMQGADVSVRQPEGGPEQGTPVQIKLVGDDLAVLERTAQSFGEILRSIDGTRNVESGVQTTAGELAVSVDPGAAQQYGVTAAQVAGTLRTAIAGITATDITTADEDTNVSVSLRFRESVSETVGATKQVDVSALQAMPVQTSRGNVPLDTFARITLEPGRSVVTHEDGERVVTVHAQTDGDANASNIVSAFQRAIEDYELPSGVTVAYGGESEDIQESFTDLAVAMAVGIFAIFALMVWQFRSYRQPLFILVTIPLALIGVFLGLTLVGQPLSFPGFIGIVALAGVVVNNAIILIDAINRQRRDQRKDITAAVRDGARSRLQPVILTTLTTVTGLVPLALTDPTWAPVAYSIMFGLLFATVLTLFVIPILYNRFAERILE